MSWHPLIKTVRQTTFACPEQYEGQLTDGSYFYFRYRFGTASLGLGLVPEEAIRTDTEKFDIGDALQGEFDSEAQRNEVFDMLLFQHGYRGFNP